MQAYHFFLQGNSWFLILPPNSCNTWIYETLFKSQLDRLLILKSNLCFLFPQQSTVQRRKVVSDESFWHRYTHAKLFSRVSCQDGSVHFCQIVAGRPSGRDVLARNVFYWLTGLEMLHPVKSQTFRCSGWIMFFKFEEFLKSMSRCGLLL